MIRFLSCTTAISAVLVAPVAMADVTPDDVWQSWQAMASMAGQELIFDSATQNGDTLEISGLVITFKDELGGSFSADLDRMNFTDNGDGTVAVTMADTYPMSLAFADDGEGPTSMKLTVTQPGMLVTAGGSAADTSYEFAAPSLTVTLVEATGADGQPVDASGDLAMTDMVGRYLVQRDGDTTTLDSSFSAKALSLNIAGADANGEGSGTLVMSLADLAGTTKGNFLGAEVMANMATALNAGFTTETSFSFGAMTLAADIDDAGNPVKLGGNLSGGSFDLAVDKEKIRYGTAFTGGNLTASGPEIPFPEVALTFAETAFGILMPVSKSEAPQDFSVMTKLVDFTISEDIWGLIDPGAALSREPATVILDVKGTGFWKQDIMDPAMQMEGVEPPGELTSLDLSEVLVKAAGAAVGATGGLTFDNTDLTSFDGMPAPTGSITVTINGANKLIDNLIAMGLLPSEEAMGVRMMMGLFARPGPNPDELTSVIEFRDGGLFANGQQLQ